MALGIGELLVHSFLYGLLKSLILEFDFGWRSGSSPAMQSCFQCPLHSLPKNSRFVSGHRFSDAASSSKSGAPLGAGQPEYWQQAL